MTNAPLDVITFEVMSARLDGIVREMENAVFRTGFSTIVRESHDFSCGLMDATGRLVARGSHPRTHGRAARVHPRALRLPRPPPACARARPTSPATRTTAAAPMPTTWS